MVDPIIWLAFGAAIIGNARARPRPRAPHGRRRPSMRASAIWSVVWTLVALAFALILLPWRGGTAASEYLTGFVLERSLSLDNLFVFAMLFSTWRCPAKAQRKVLFFGIIGAIVLRLIFILAGRRAARRRALVDLPVRRPADRHRHPHGAATATRRSTPIATRS